VAVVSTVSNEAFTNCRQLSVRYHTRPRNSAQALAAWAYLAVVVSVLWISMVVPLRAVITSPSL
jgi:hypothetical protein